MALLLHETNSFNNTQGLSGKTLHLCKTKQDGDSILGDR